MASTAEVEAGRAYLDEIAEALEARGVQTKMLVRHSRNPMQEIVRYANEMSADLVVMGAHGHKGLTDLVFGTTIDAVRHRIQAPVLIVRDER